MTRIDSNEHGLLGWVYELEDFTLPTPETLHRLRAMIDQPQDTDPWDPALAQRRE